MDLIFDDIIHHILNGISQKNNIVKKWYVRSRDIKDKDYSQAYVKLLSENILELKYIPTPQYAQIRKNYGASSLYKIEQMKLGSFITKFMGEFNKSEIEDFIYSFRGAYNDLMSIDDFIIVKGEDIVKWYSKKNSTINTCMSGKNSRVRFYAMNPDKVRLLVLLDESKKCVGRCLLWKLDYPKGKIFADRIYYKKYSDERRFMRYIHEKGWLSRSGTGDKYSNSRLVVLDTFLGKLPFFDSFYVAFRIPTILKSGNPPTSYIKAIINSFKFNKQFENLNNFQDFIK